MVGTGKGTGRSWGPSLGSIEVWSVTWHGMAQYTVSCEAVEGKDKQRTASGQEGKCWVNCQQPQP